MGGKITHKILKTCKQKETRQIDRLMQIYTHIEIQKKYKTNFYYQRIEMDVTKLNNREL